MSTIALSELHEVLDRPLDCDLDATIAALDEFAARRDGESPEARRASNRVLGAPAWMHVDLSDADPHWHAHTCVSDDTGACPSCTAYVAAGGVL